FQKNVLRQLVKISTDVGQVTRLLNQSSSLTAFEDSEIPGVVIPMNSWKEFTSLNDWLITKDNTLTFTNYLKGIGGIDTENLVQLFGSQNLASKGPAAKVNIQPAMANVYWVNKSPSNYGLLG
ncbi:unnamed protein product, partial [Allacma fusca]